MENKDEISPIERFLRKHNGKISLVILLLISIYAVYEIRISSYDNLKECATKYSELYANYTALLEDLKYRNYDYTKPILINKT